MAMHNRDGPFFYLKMPGQSSNHGRVRTPIFSRLTNFDNQRSIGCGCHANLFCTWHNFDR